MIIWIDGANGVGKSHVAAKLEELLSNRNAEYIESDLYWVELIQNNFLKALNGFEPYNNKYCLETIRTVLEEKFQKHNKMPIISMSLVVKRCQEELLDYFEKKNVPMVHIILEAEKETIISRIENDPIRDNNAQNQQKSKIDWQIHYLRMAYPSAIRINTEGKSLDEIANEIVTLL